MLILAMCEMEEKDESEKTLDEQATDAHASGKAMCRAILKHCCGMEKIEVIRGERGKPILKDSEIGYSISHSASLVVCGINLPKHRLLQSDCSVFPENWHIEFWDEDSCGDLGIDVEWIRGEDFLPSCQRISNRMFLPAEQKQFAKASNPLDTFFLTWSAKESFGKWTGRGILDFKEFDSCNVPENFVLTTKILQFDSGRYSFGVLWETKPDAQKTRGKKLKNAIKRSVSWLRERIRKVWEK